MGCVYLVRNTLNNKLYVGKTVQLFRQRKSKHLSTARRGKGHYFHKALSEYGSDSFDWTILVTSDDNTVLCREERAFIAMLHTTAPMGYNLTLGGDGMAGFTLSESCKAKLRAFHTGRKHSPETLAKLSAAKAGKKRGPHSAETIEKIRASNLGLKRSAETCRRNSEAQRGTKRPPRSAEWRAKLSEAAKRQHAQRV